MEEGERYERSRKISMDFQPQPRHENEEKGG
jgi:hypothetical protein